MAIRVAFANETLADQCSTSDAVDRTWQQQADSVRLALSVLSACDDRSDFEQLPNVLKKGDHTVFRTQQADVVMQITNLSGSTDVVIKDLAARPRGSRS